MFKAVLHDIIMLPLSIIAAISAGLAAAIIVLDKPISAAFGMKEEYDNHLDHMIEDLDEIKDNLKFDD